MSEKRGTLNLTTIKNSDSSLRNIEFKDGMKAGELAEILQPIFALMALDQVTESNELIKDKKIQELEQKIKDLEKEPIVMSKKKTK